MKYTSHLCQRQQRIRDTVSPEAPAGYCLPAGTVSSDGVAFFLLTCFSQTEAEISRVLELSMDKVAHKFICARRCKQGCPGESTCIRPLVSGSAAYIGKLRTRSKGVQ